MRSPFGSLAIGLTACLVAGSAFAGDTVTLLDQERTTTAFGIVPACNAEDFDSDAARGFDPFATTSGVNIECPDGFALAWASQSSTVQPSLLLAFGAVSAQASSPAPQVIHAIATSQYEVTFAVNAPTAFTASGVVTAGSGENVQNPQFGAVFHLFDDESDILEITALPEGGSSAFVPVQGQGVLLGGTYTLRVTATAIIDNQIPPGLDGSAMFEVALALAPACLGDLDGNGSVDGADLGALLVAWGTDDALADLDGSGSVDGIDLGLLLAAWGDCP